MLSKEDKERAVEQFRKDHALYFETAGINPLNYYPKMVTMHQNVACLALFPSEFGKPGGFYTEVISFGFETANPRKLLKFHGGYDYAAKYPKLTFDRYAVPMTEFDEVNTAIAFMGRDVSIPKSTEQTIIEVGEQQQNVPDQHRTNNLPDKPYSELTARDHMAILTWKPISNDEWINDIIKTTKKTK